MKLLPNAEHAKIPIEKLRDYSLGRDHPVGKHKARVFESALGMTSKDASRLRDLVLQAVLVNEAVDQGSNKHGTRYFVDFQVFGTKGPVTVPSAWIIDKGESIPRPTSCYVVR